MNQERIVQGFFFAFLALITWELYRVFAPFLMPIAWAILLAFLAHPALTLLDRRLRSRSTSALLITILVALGVALPAIWLSEHLVIEAQALYGEMSGFSPADWMNRLATSLRETPTGARLADVLAAHGLRLDDEIKALLMQAATYMRDYAIAHGSSVASNLAGFVFHFGIGLLTLFYLLRDGESYYEALRALTPMHEQDKAAVFDTLAATLSSVMRGLMLTAALDGVSIGLGYLACGVPYWAFLAILTAGAGLLPFGGTTIIWVPATAYLAVAGNWTNAIALAAWSISALAVIDNFLKPIAMRHGTGLPTLALFFGLAGGIAAYGPVGIFAGPAVISVFASLLRVYERTYTPDMAESPATAETSPAPPIDSSAAPSDALRHRSAEPPRGN